MVREEREVVVLGVLRASVVQYSLDCRLLLRRYDVGQREMQVELELDYSGDESFKFPRVQVGLASDWWWSVRLANPHASMPLKAPIARLSHRSTVLGRQGCRGHRRVLIW